MRISDWSSDVCSSDLFKDQALEIKFNEQLKERSEVMGLVESLISEAKEKGLEKGLEEGLEQGHEQGHEQGLQEGIEKGNLSVVRRRSEEHTSEIQSLMRISYDVFCLKKKKIVKQQYI